MKISLTKFFKLFCLLGASLLMTATVQAQAGLIINSPSDLEGIYTDIGDAAFGPQLDVIDAITGDLVLADDNEGCTTGLGENSIINGADLAGNIAIIDRGSCEFQQKTGNAQEFGAIAVIICLVDESDPFPMGGTNDTLTIPAILITLDLCNQIRVALDSGPVNATIGNPFNLSQSTAAYANSTPCSQVTLLEDLTTTITNRTDNEQTNIIATCEITDPNGMVTTYTETIDALDARTDSVVTFEGYLPSALGEYTVRYSNNGTDIGNYTAGLDEESMSFSITQSYYSLNEEGANLGGASAGEGSFSMGALYFTEEDAEATSANFAINNPADMVGEILTVILYELTEDAATIDLSTLSVVGFYNHDVTADDVADQWIEAPLTNFNDPNEPIVMLGDRIYVLMVEYIGNETFNITTSGSTNYPTVASIVVAPDDTGASTWYTGGFTSGVTALLRLNIASTNDCVVSTTIPELAPDQVTLMPNPASETANIAVELTEVSKTVQIHMFDVMGRSVQSNVYNNVKDQIFTVDVSNLASGTYFVSVITDEGRRTMRLAVSH